MRQTQFALVLTLGFAAAMPAAAQKLFGFADSPAEPFGNIVVNTTTADWKGSFLDPDSPFNIDQLNARGLRPLVIANGLFFNVSKSPPSLLLNWKSRVNNYLAVYGSSMNAAHIAGFVIESQANDDQVSADLLEEMAAYLQTKGISQDLIGFGEGLDNPLPFIPQHVGFVAIGDYRLDALDPNGGFYQREIAQIQSMLADGQSFIMVPKGFRYVWESRTSVPDWRLGQSAKRFADYCVGDVRCRGVVIFLGSTLYSVLDDTFLIGAESTPGAWAGDRAASGTLLAASPP